jgi:uncharacterized protein YcbK (DUF882 family)
MRPAKLVFLFLVSATPPAFAEVTHVVQRGHTIEAIAHRYHVSEKAILEANHITDPRHLTPGQTLVIPAAVPAEGKAPHHTGVVHAVRAGEEFHVHTKDAHGHIPAAALKAFERMMRQGNVTHPVDPRLVALVAIVADHFGGKPIEIVSGYRAYTPTQYTAHSNHNAGRAIDFRIRGVKNEELRDFCRTLRNAGCGYYPNSSFVHLDVRDSKAYWVDWSRPGEPPRYDRPGVDADEGTSDVPEDHPSETDPPLN